MKCLLTLFFFLATAQGHALSLVELFKEHKIPNHCLLELINGSDITGSYINGNILDIEEWMNKPPFVKKNYPICSDEDMAQSFEERYYNSFQSWEYLGTTGNLHVIITHMHGDTWALDTILVLKFVTNGVSIVSSIIGDKHCPIGSAKLKGDTLIHWQGIAANYFFHLTAEIYPELQELFPEPCGIFKIWKDKVIGYSLFHNVITRDGEIGPDKMVAFTSWEGWAPYSGKEYQQEGLKDLVIQMSKDDRELF
jgi:hypothetical protein